MYNYLFDDTIAAIATANGQGAIAIVRLSGSQAIEVVKKVFVTKEDLTSVEPWKAIFGKIYDEEQEVDEVIVIKYKAPNSYTKEDMVEINCHGGIYVSQRILEVLLKKGARLAQPGEFTLRAFLNGRIDLSQAEAVADIIQSQTSFSLQTSLKQLHGKLSDRIKQIRDSIMESCSLLELELDFAEENVEFVDRTDFLIKLDDIKEELNELITTYKIGRIAREGVKLVIAGKPNVGKSSLLNVLVKEERAIVTDFPGTTRDPLEVQLDLKGILFRVYDTAGLTRSDNPIEIEGIKRTEEHLQTADIIIHLFDGSQPLTSEDFEIIQKIDKIKHAKVVRVINKTDLPIILDKSKLYKNSVNLLSISALNKIGIKEFEEIVLKLITEDSEYHSQEALVTNVRHYEALKRAISNLEKTKGEIEKGMSSEFVAVYLRDALDDLGQVVGTVTSEDILNHIFSKFCIGK